MTNVAVLAVVLVVSEMAETLWAVEEEEAVTTC